MAQITIMAWHRLFFPFFPYLQKRKNLRKQNMFKNLSHLLQTFKVPYVTRPPKHFAKFMKIHFKRKSEICISYDMKQKHQYVLN